MNKHELTQFVAKATNLPETQAGKTINAFNLLHAIVSAKAKCYFNVAKSMKAKETQEPPEHPVELTKVSIQAPTTTDSLMVSGCAMYLSASKDTEGIS